MQNQVSTRGIPILHPNFVKSVNKPPTWKQFAVRNGELVPALPAPTFVRRVATALRGGFICLAASQVIDNFAGSNLCVRLGDFARRVLGGFAGPTLCGEDIKRFCWPRLLLDSFQQQGRGGYLSQREMSFRQLCMVGFRWLCGRTLSDFAGRAMGNFSRRG